MKAPIVAAALIAAMSGSAVANEIHYDRNLERAVLGIVKQRIGHIRGPLAFDAVVIQTEGVDGMATSSVMSPSMRRLGGSASPGPSQKSVSRVAIR